MINGKDLKPQDMGITSEQLTKIDSLMDLPAPFDKPGMEPEFTEPKEEWRKKFCASLDGYIGVDALTRPETKEEEAEFVKKFLNGLENMLSDQANRNLILPVLLSFEYCAKCNTCSEACHIFLATNGHELYRPIFRSEVLRKIAKKHMKGEGLVASFIGGDIDINWETIARLAELAYRCNLCRRCAQTCPLGIDNGLLTREIRKIFSMEMGIAPKPIHEKGAALQIKTGSSTGMSGAALVDDIEFIEEDYGKIIGRSFKMPVNKKGADILLTHNAGEFKAWPENPAAFAILFEEAGLNWTLSTEYMGYDNVNYGAWYDDSMTRKIALDQLKVAKDLGVKRIILGECGHAHRATIVTADRLLTGEDLIPRESFLPLLWELIRDKKLKVDPSKNNFPVTMHDPCNMARMMGIVKPQLEITKAVVPESQYRDMYPGGVNNFCCGGGSGFAILKSMNFSEFRTKVSVRVKFKQILDAFQGVIEDVDTPKYIAAPCSNCKGAIRDILKTYKLTDKYNVHYGGVVELVVNALVSIEKPFLDFLREDEDDE